jgi:hypothetical protein
VDGRVNALQQQGRAQQQSRFVTSYIGRMLLQVSSHMKQGARLMCVGWCTIHLQAEKVRH